MSKVAVLLLGFGGPECIEDVGPFVENITGRKMPPERLAASEDKYRLIGGGSPLRKTSEAQSRLIEERLATKYPDLKVYLGMRYWHPLTSDIVTDIVKSGVNKVVVICLSPYYSYATSQEYISHAIDLFNQSCSDIEVVVIKDWNEEPALINGYAAELREAVAAAGSDAAVVFTAHSIPMTMVESGDPYPKQIAATAALVARAVGVGEYSLGWQSEGQGRGEWLKPTVYEIFAELAGKGVSEVVIMPIGFTSDHVETLFDIDIEMKNDAEQAGLVFSRACCLNTKDNAIDAMVSAIRGVLVKAEGDGK